MKTKMCNKYINVIKRMGGRAFMQLRRTKRNSHSSLSFSHSSFFILFFSLLILTSCEYTPYESGEGELSELRADYADITVKQGRVVNIITDDDESLAVPSSLEYVEKKDTVVRRLLYYNKSVDAQPIHIVGQKAVSMITPLKWKGQETASTDPLTLTAAWMSANKRYMNLQLGIKVGSSEEDAAQSIALRCDSVSTYNKGAMWLTLCHNQAGMPEYYTKELLYSVSTKLLPDTVYLTVNTYSGKKTLLLVK